MFSFVFLQVFFSYEGTLVVFQRLIFLQLIFFGFLWSFILDMVFGDIVYIILGLGVYIDNIYFMFSFG